MVKKFLVVGAGFSGAVVARELVNNLNCQVDIWEARPHLGGNCHTERDSDTGVMVHKYGPHIFNTDSDRIWYYVSGYGDFIPFINRVKAITPRGVFSMPINLHTINQFFGKSYDPDAARFFVQSLGDPSIETPENFEQAILKSLGYDLYENFFKGYTLKQWGVHPRELPASIFGRLPIRFNYNDSYYDKKYQAIPRDGYSSIIKNILSHHNIEVYLNKPFIAADRSEIFRHYDHVFYTGPIDAFFGNSLGRLGYRTVYFEPIKTELEDYQGAAVLNYTSEEVPWTRIHEHKHFAPWESHTKTSVYREYSKETGANDEPYYPKRLGRDKWLLNKYIELAKGFERGQSLGCGVSFLGRLGTYRYLDMGPTIQEALLFSNQAVECLVRGKKPRTFFEEAGLNER